MSNQFFSGSGRGHQQHNKHGCLNLEQTALPRKIRIKILTNELQTGEAFSHRQHGALRGHFSHRSHAFLTNLIMYLTVLHSTHPAPEDQSVQSHLPAAPQLHCQAERRIALDHWGFTNPPLPSRKWGQHQCQSSPAGVALTPLTGDWLLRAHGQWKARGPAQKGIQEMGGEQWLAQGDLVRKSWQRPEEGVQLTEVRRIRLLLEHVYRMYEKHSEKCKYLDYYSFSI